MAHTKMAQVRQHYDFRCGYCGVSEADSGGELTVDHFLPVSAGGDDSTPNLVYACFRCNFNKSDQLPGAAEDTLRLLHPKKDNLAVHLREDETSGLLKGLTETGRFHIASLRLNRTALVLYRQKRLLDQMTARTLEQVTGENSVLRDDMAQLKLYTANLEEQLGLLPQSED